MPIFLNEDLRLLVNDPPWVTERVAVLTRESGLQSPHSGGQDITTPSVSHLLLTSP